VVVIVMVVVPTVDATATGFGVLSARLLCFRFGIVGKKREKVVNFSPGGTNWC